MAKTKHFCVLNITAHPHPVGAYRDLFKSVQRKPAKFFGDLYAAISPLSRSRNGVFHGRLAVWTQVDESSDVIDTESFEEIAFRASDVVIPGNRGLNSKVFDFSFNEETHFAYVELGNDQGKTMSPGRIRLAFSSIFDRHQKEFEEVYVTLIPERETLEAALSMAQLRYVEMLINRPNPDEFDSETAEVLAELEAQGASSQRLEFTKSSNSIRLNLNPRNILLARVASIAGFFKAIGKDLDGKRQEYLTKNHPKIVKKVVDNNSNTVATLITIARGE